MLWFAGSLTAFMFFLMNPTVAHWYLPVLGLATGAAFVRRELRIDQPFLDLPVLRGNVPLLATFARQCLAHTTSYAFFYGFSQWLQEGRGLSASQAGLLLLPLSATAIGVTGLTGRRSRVRGRLVVGAFFQCLGCAALLLLHADSPAWLLVALSAVVGIPHGLIGLANQNALYAQAAPARMGSSAGLLRTFRYIGALFAAAASAVFLRDGATSSGLHAMAWMLIGVAAVFLVLCTADRSLGRVGATPGDAVLTGSGGSVGGRWSRARGHRQACTAFTGTPRSRSSSAAKRTAAECFSITHSERTQTCPSASRSKRIHPPLDLFRLSSLSSS
jgi:hypothetical protein